MNAAARFTTGAVWTSRNETERHGFLIAGWGRIVDCPSANNTLFSFENNPSTELLYSNYSSTPHSTGQFFVPYVIDFSGGVDPMDDPRKVITRPRPFYCSLYNDPNAEIFQQVRDGFAFYELPDRLIITVEQLYVSNLWTWNTPVSN